MYKSRENLSKHGDTEDVTTYKAGIIQATMHRKLQKFCDEILEPYGITKAQWLIIGTVFDHRATGIRLTELASIVGTNMPYMTNAVNLLEQKKILCRVENHQDNRSSFVTVSSRFMPKCKKIEASLREALREKVYSSIEPQEFKVYMKVMSRLAE